MKQLARPVGGRHPVRPGSNVKGKVVRLTEFGAFIELEAGWTACPHLADVAAGGRAADVVQLGDELTVKVIRIEPNERRIGLSLRDLAADMPPMEEEEHRGRRGRSARPRPVRQRR